MAAGDWPEFRGPWGNGRASASGSVKSSGIPLSWSETENVKWKTSIPHKGWSTPVVMNGQIWLTTATVKGHDFFVICVDANSGAIVLNEKLFHSDNPEPLGNPLNSYASPSPVIESGRVYVHFGSYGTACLNTKTFEVLWKRSDLPCRHLRGPGSSLVLFEDLLILTMDGVDVQYLIALDKTTGQTVWKTDRTAEWDDLDADGKPKDEGDLRKAYSTPLLIDVDGNKQMLSVGAKAVYGYDPADGREIWKVHTPAYSGASRPVYGHGTAYIISGFGTTELLAVRVDGSGDVTDTNIVWKTEKSMPRTPSPLLIDDLLFTINDSGITMCLEALTGRQVWEQRIRGNYAASLLYADGRIYCFDWDGKTTVFRAARHYELLATNKLDSGFMASAAVSGKSLFLRTKTHLYRIESSR
ncbi:MAG: PQQ-binding-like beta-propeller repeat protein [Planctomycetes bacterium]|nr:PQQ-binding-like beta-propeller repeat protein [Planctomycetota bacterium]MBL7144139.1 PQQ-binding-like beta-propeller repeat protein [Phycisphaerae bacterium]